MLIRVPHQLIEEMLDEGHPLTMETNMLKDIVLPPTLVRKLLNAAGVSALVINFISDTVLEAEHLRVTAVFTTKIQTHSLLPFLGDDLHPDIRRMRYTLILKSLWMQL
jgi:hypothetical protein